MSLSLLDADLKLAALLAPVTDDDPDVQAAIVDAVTPPALIVGWQAPMRDTFGPCTAFANLSVAIVAERLDTAAGVETIKAQVHRIDRLLVADSATGWARQPDSGIGTIEIAKVLYLACRVDVRVPIGL